jgi:hypothetical protein
MPQEQINFPDPGEASVSIHWSKAEVGANAQVGISIPTRELREYLDAMDKDTEDHTIFWYTPTLARTELNKLISVTRRARNAAYGADE